MRNEREFTEFARSTLDVLVPSNRRRNAFCGAAKSTEIVMAGLVPAIQVFLAARLLRRGCPALQTSLRSLRKGRLLRPGMTASLLPREPFAKCELLCCDLAGLLS